MLGRCALSSNEQDPSAGSGDITLAGTFTEALREVVGVDLKVSATTGGGAAPAPPSSSEPERSVNEAPPIPPIFDPFTASGRLFL